MKPLLLSMITIATAGLAFLGYFAYRELLAGVLGFALGHRREEG
jgi:hypothetical protein